MKDYVALVSHVTLVSSTARPRWHTWLAYGYNYDTAQFSQLIQTAATACIYPLLFHTRRVSVDKNHQYLKANNK